MLTRYERPALGQVEIEIEITRLSKDIDTVVTSISMMGERLAVTLFILPLTALSMVLSPGCRGWCL